MNSPFIRILTLITFSFSCSLINGAYAQRDEVNVPAQMRQHFLNLVSSQLQQSPTDTLPLFFIEQIENYCEKDLDCQWDACWIVVNELNARTKYFEAIPLTDELIRLAQEREDLEGEAQALWMLRRFYNFMEDIEMTAKINHRILAIREEQQNIGQIIYIKKAIASHKAYNLNEVEQAIADLKDLLAQATELELERSQYSVLITLKSIYEDFGYTALLPAIVEEMEKIPISDPIKHGEYEYFYHAVGGRANLFLLEKNYEEAEKRYQQVLALTKTRFEGRGDFWWELYILHRLARLEWERGDTAKANAYLDEAYEKSVEFQLQDQTTINLKMRIEMAEATDRYADALAYSRALYAHQAKIDSISADFDAKRYYTQLANERLEAEKSSQALELRLKNYQLITLLVIVALALILAAGLFFGFRKQSQRRRELHEQNNIIREQAEQLKNLDQAKTRFFANVSHELRTPLTLILGPIQTILQENQLTARQAKLLKMANKSGKRLQQLIGEILDLRKLELNKMDVTPQATSVATFFNRQLSQFESLAERNGVDFSIDIAVEEQVVADLDREKMRQIIANLLSNAFKFTPPGGQIKVAVALQEARLHFSVTDTGQGIHPDDLPHIFDRYFQTKRPEKPIEGGTGIGLAICQEYAHLFGGTITIESEINKGTTFALSFPVTLVKSTQPAALPDLKIPSFPPKERTATVEKTPSQHANQQRPKILVVEDNPDLSDYLQLLLSEKYEVVTAENGQRAWDYILPENGNSPAPDFQLILSDLMMPVMDGFQLLEKLKATDATRHIPVVMLTARADARDKLKALRIGVDDYLVKPFQEEELKVRIANLLQNQANRLAALPPEKAPSSSTCLLSQSEQEWLARFETYVQQNFGSDILSVPFLAHEFAMSESTLYRQLKRLTGLSPGQYLKEVRLDQARQLLENRTYDSVERVANAVGYGDYRAFSRSFKQRFGRLPSSL